MPSRRDWYVAALLIGLGGLFLAGAAAVRWVPCLGDASAGCQARQSRAFDYLVPVEPSQAWPATAVLAGIGLLLVAAAWPFLIRRLPLRRPALRTAAGAIMMAKPAVLGLLVLVAPVVGVLPRSASPVVLVAEIVLDLAVLVVVLATPNDRVADYQRLLVAAVAVWLTGWVGRVLDALVFGLLAPDAEVAPGSGLLTGVVLMICGGGLAALTATAQERQLPSGAARTTLERPTHG
ncbi:MAG TPA: hypothetical protein VK401_04280 [Propionibacteriaceae bacterium]|jgi:hypothetical protein|nr:hypothetical protein [Propionibacteriaceae bacterium]